MEIGREAKRNVGEKSTGYGGVQVLGKWTGDESRKEADGNGGHETKKETKHRDRYT